MTVAYTAKQLWREQYRADRLDRHNAEIAKAEAETEERRRVFKDFLRRGFVVIDEELPDGTATFHWINPDHPEVVAFNSFLTRH